jgi:hypothetical protein
LLESAQIGEQRLAQAGLAHSGFEHLARSRAAWFMEVALKVADPHELRLAKGDGGFEQTHTKGGM